MRWDVRVRLCLSVKWDLLTKRLKVADYPNSTFVMGSSICSLKKIFLYFKKRYTWYYDDFRLSKLSLVIELAVPQSCLVPSSVILLDDHSRKIQSKQWNLGPTGRKFSFTPCIFVLFYLLSFYFKAKRILRGTSIIKGVDLWKHKLTVCLNHNPLQAGWLYWWGGWVQL